jgi:hypothetical protein
LRTIAGEQRLACLCISRLARRFGVVSARAEALLRKLADDPAMGIANSRVLDARDDLDTFLRRS